MANQPYVFYQRLASLPPVIPLHAKDLDHANEDVDKVQLKADALVDNISLHQASLGHPGVRQDLLDVVQSEATEDSETTVQPDLLRPHQRAGSSSGKNKGRKSGESNDGHTSEQRATEVQVLLLLGSRSNKSNRAHHSNSVKTGTRENSGVHEHQWGEERSLREVEPSPQSILHDVAIAVVRKNPQLFRKPNKEQTYFSGGV